MIILRFNLRQKTLISKKTEKRPEYLNNLIFYVSKN